MASRDYSFLSEEDTQANQRDYSFMGEEEPEKGFFESAADTVVETVEAIPKYAKGLYEGIPAAFENRREIASKINASLGSAQVGVASALGQAGSAANEYFGYEGPGALTDALNDYVEGNKGKASARLESAIKQLEESESKQKLTPEGEFIRKAATSTLETSGSMLAGGATKSVATGIVAMGPQVFGQQYEQLKKEGESESGAVLHGAAKTAIELASEALPLKKLLNMPDGIVRKIADMTLVEGGTEAASSIGDSIYDASVRDKNLNWDEEFNKATEAFKLGAVAGGITGGAVAAPQAAGVVTEGITDTTKSIVDTFKKKIASSESDQIGQPSELFNPTHKAGGGVDVQVATKNGKIVPDTYVTAQGETIRDANAVANNPDESVDVTLDVSAVAESIKAEVMGDSQGTPLPELSKGSIDSTITKPSTPEENQVISDPVFPAPEPVNQENNQTNIVPTLTETRQGEINKAFQGDVAPVQPGFPAEQPVTQTELNQKTIEDLAAGDLIGETRAAQQAVQPQLLTATERAEAQPELVEAKQQPKKLEPKGKTEGKVLFSKGVVDESDKIDKTADVNNKEVENIFRGESTLDGDGNYYSTDKEFARNYTQSGLDSEIASANIKSSDIFTRETLPSANNEKEMDGAISEAKAKGFKAVRVSEGKKQPSSIYVINKAAVSPQNEVTESLKFKDLEKVPDLGKPAKEIKADIKRDSKEIQAQIKTIKKSNDTIGQFISRSGGLNRESMAREGVDPENFKDKAKVFGKPMFPRQGGMTADDLAEVLNEQGFRGGNLTANDALDLILETMDGDTTFINEAVSAELESLQRESDALQQIRDKVEAAPKPKKLEKVKDKIAPQETKPDSIAEDSPVTPLKDKEIKKTEIQENATNPYRAMTGKEISYEVEVEETGETYTVTVDTATVMKGLDTRLDALQKLRECI